MIAHVAGAPVEELLLLVLASGSGTGLLAYARSWTMWPANREESDRRALVSDEKLTEMSPPTM